MKHIRPKQFFAMYDAPASERGVNLRIPHREGLGGLMLLETFLMIAAARVVAAKRIFEFGTFMGATTLALAENTDARIFTIDLGEDIPEQIPEEAVITDARKRIGKLDFDNSPVEARITQLFGDSTKFDFSPLYASMDMVFIDGGHELPVVTSDTDNAFAMLLKSKRSCILWHDYGNPDYPELVSYLDHFDLGLVHVEGTWLCAYFQGVVNV